MSGPRTCCPVHGPPKRATIFHLTGLSSKLRSCCIFTCKGNVTVNCRTNFGSLLFFCGKKYTFASFSSGPGATYCNRRTVLSSKLRVVANKQDWTKFAFCLVRLLQDLSEKLDIGRKLSSKRFRGQNNSEFSN